MKKISKVLMMVLLPMIGISYAYETATCNGYDLKWDTNSLNVESSNVSFPSGNSYTTALDYALDGISDAPANFTLTRSGTGGVSRGNGDSETWFSTDPIALSSAPAVAWTWSNCWSFLWWGANDITEVDVIFDADFDYTSGTRKSVMVEYDGSSRPFRGTAIHEFSHALGLKHENDEYNVLGQSYSHIHANGSNARSYMGEDAADGAVYLYGSSGSSEDVAVSHFEWSGRSGEYSKHDRTEITDTSGTVLSKTTIDGEPVYNVTKGQQVKINFTFENNGRNTQNNIDIGYYLSTNDYITTFDDRLAGKTMSLGRNSVYNSTKTLTIPSTLVSGDTYWLGVIIDENDIISEIVEWNNATYIGIKVQ